MTNTITNAVSTPATKADFDAAKKVVRFGYTSNLSQIWHIFTGGKWRRVGVCEAETFLTENFGMSSGDFSKNVKVFDYAEEFHRARKVIHTYEYNDRRYWQARNCFGEFEKINKATAIAILWEFGLTIATFLDEQEKFIVAELNRAAAEIAAEEKAALEARRQAEIERQQRRAEILKAVQNANLAETDMPDSSRKWFKANGYKFLATIADENVRDERLYNVSDNVHKTFELAVAEIEFVAESKYGTAFPWAIKNIDGQILASGRDFCEFAEWLEDREDDTDVFSFLPDFDEQDDDDNELVDEPEIITSENGDEYQLWCPDEFKPELLSALKDIYLDDRTDNSGNIVPAIQLRDILGGFPAYEESTTAYRKNSDGTFTEDKDAYNRLREVEDKILDGDTEYLDALINEPERTRLYPDDMRELWLSQEWTFDIWIRAEDWDENEIELTDEDLAAVEKALRGRYYINRDGQGIEFFAEDADEPALNAIIDELAERGCAIEDYHEHWEEERAETRIDDFSDKISRISAAIETLEEICADFDSDTDDFEKEWYIAKLNRFYTQEIITDTTRRLNAMRKWYEHRAE